MKISLPPRRLIPRWRRVSATLATSEALPATPGPAVESPLSDEMFENAVASWREERSPGRLGGVLGFSLSGDFGERLKSIAREVEKEGAPVTEAQRALLFDLSGESEEDELLVDSRESRSYLKREVSSLRSLLRTNPANPLALLDFGQLQASIGKMRVAERSLRAALSLSPNSRVVLRTLARFLVHVGRLGEAHDVLVRHPRTASDPWLMASEIAISQVAGRSSKFASRGWKTARDWSGSIEHVSELAGALGGLEMDSGHARQARELFRVALRAPNDNVIAQAITDQHRLGIDLSGPVQRQSALLASEARAIISRDCLDLASAERSAKKWSFEEPYSSRPIKFLTALLAVGGSHEEALEWSKRGLLADPFDAAFYANIAYCLAALGRLDESEDSIRKAIAVGREEYVGHCTATKGLIAMQQGEFGQADRLYEAAIEFFLFRKEYENATVCHAYYARAAQVLSHPRSGVILAEAAAAYRRKPIVDAAILLRSVDATFEQERQPEARRRLAQWIYDSERNLIVRREGVTDVGAPEFIVKPRPM